MTILVLKAPLAGWCLPLAEVPDPVFAERMAGDGVAIDPTGNVLHAPCDGEVVPMERAKHAVTIRTPEGLEILLHVGIDTVQLNGEGFEPLVSPGARVKTGQALLRFDLDLVARRTKSAVTPIVVASGGVVRRRSDARALEVGDFLMEIEPGATEAAAKPEASEELARLFTVPFDHGFHARPAALVAAALRPFAAEVAIVARGRRGNARSTVALMSLGVHCGETIEVRARGSDAEGALAALAPLLAPVSARPSPRPPPKAEGATSRRLAGVIACRGLAIGQAAQFSQPEIQVMESGAGEAREAERLRAALAAVKAHLEKLAGAARGEQRSILSAHIELVQDPGLAEEARSWLRRGKSAGYAWRQVVRTGIAALDALGDTRMMERAADLRDLEQQVLRVLDGHAPGGAHELPERAIVLADELFPSQLMALDRSRLAGICMARGGATSHVAIIAAAMGLPALVAVGAELLEIADGTALVLDAEQGRLEIDPAPAERAVVQQALGARTAQYERDLSAAWQEARTLDQVRITVHANLGALAEVANALAFGAEGCGLLRTEFLFLERRAPPDEDEQAREYQAIASALAGRALTIRTLDIGGDKQIPYLPLPREENPALGLRGLRTSLWRPDLLRTQLRAILRVQPLAQCRLLLPMVTDVEDVRTVRAILEEAREALGLAALPRLGVMIETPASALIAGQLAREADFLSIGTNDLSQYTLAMDRGHPVLAAKLDALHPAVLKLIAAAAEAGHAAGKEVAVCGALASDLAAIPILIGLGIRELSAVPAAIPRIKATIRALEERACAELALQALEQPTASAVRTLAAAWPGRETLRQVSGGKP